MKDFYTASGVPRRAAGMLRGAISTSPDDVARNIATAASPIEGVQPTLAEVAKDPGIAGFQRGAGNVNAERAAALGERHDANALARTRAASASFGDGTPQAMQDDAAAQLAAAERASVAQQAQRQAGVDKRLADTATAATADRATAEQALSEHIGRIGPVADRDATGTEARAAYDTAYDAARGRTREAYSAPVLTTPQPIEIARPFFARMTKTLDDFYGDGGGYVPEALRSIISDSAAEGATTRTLTNIDRSLADFAGQSRMAGNRSDAAVAERIRGDLSTFVQKAAPPEYSAALANAKAVRAEQGRVFETGDVAAALGRNRYGNPTTGDNALSSKLVRPGAAGGDTADQLVAAVGPERAESVVRQEMRRLVDEGAVRTPQQARALTVKYGEMARRFPGVQSDLATLQARTSALDAAGGAETVALRAGPTPEEKAAVAENAALHDHILASPLKQMADPGTDPSSFVTSLLRRSDDGRRLRVLAGGLSRNEDAMNSFRRALGDYIVTAGEGPKFTAAGDRVPAPNATRKAIDTVLARAGPVLTPQQKITLHAVRRELEQANFAFTAAKTDGAPTAMNIRSPTS